MILFPDKKDMNKLTSHMEKEILLAPFETISLMGGHSDQTDDFTSFYFSRLGTFQGVRVNLCTDFGRERKYLVDTHQKIALEHMHSYSMRLLSDGFAHKVETALLERTNFQFSKIDCPFISSENKLDRSGELDVFSIPEDFQWVDITESEWFNNFSREVQGGQLGINEALEQYFGKFGLKNGLWGVRDLRLCFNKHYSFLGFTFIGKTWMGDILVDQTLDLVAMRNLKRERLTPENYDLLTEAVQQLITKD